MLNPRRSKINLKNVHIVIISFVHLLLRLHLAIQQHRHLYTLMLHKARRVCDVLAQRHYTPVSNLERLTVFTLFAQPRPVKKCPAC